MRVTFVDGPLDGREEEIPDERLEQGQPVYWPSRDELEDEDAGTPGVEGAVEYLYEGEGRARYVGGRITGQQHRRVAPDVYLEVGSKRAFAGAVEWPGWCRGGRDAEAALDALLASGPRYARALRGTRLGFTAPTSLEDLSVAERLRGDATTDFGAPSIAPKADRAPIEGEALDRQVRILRACWRAFDRAVEAARGVALAKGPRGGGRELDQIVRHVVGAEAGYARMIAASPPAADDDPAAAAPLVRRAVIEGVLRAAAQGLPSRGPRGGKRWTVRYFVRRAAWHVLDHAWEIEDRS